MAVDIVAPKTYKDAMSSDLHEQWAEAIRKELQGLIDFKVWKSRSEGRNDGTPPYIHRLRVQGETQCRRNSRET